MAIVFMPLVMVGKQEEGTLSGKIELQHGYVDALKPGVSCIDSSCGQIWKPRGLTIDYGLDGGAELEEDKDFATFVYCKDHVNGQIAEFALHVDPTDKTKRLHISYPDEAFFSANLRDSDDIRTMMSMILTFRGKHYNKEERSGALICGGLRDEVNNAFSQMQVNLINESTHRDWRAETDDGGHFKFGDLPAGSYSLHTTAYKDELGCVYPPRSWRIRVGPGERLLMYRVMISVTKKFGCRADQ